MPVNLGQTAHNVIIPVPGREQLLTILVDVMGIVPPMKMRPAPSVTRSIIPPPPAPLAMITTTQGMAVVAVAVAIEKYSKVLDQGFVYQVILRIKI
jgi:hypothetical protein